jgi:peptide/nickel transport system substrate-binding protein
MAKRIVWVLLSCLIVAALVLTSCGPKVVEEKKKEVVPEKKEEVTKPTVEEKEEVVAVKEEPKYGGTLTVLHVHCALEPATWDPADCNWIIEPFTCPYMEKLVEGDFEKYGPRGTNQFPFTDMEYVPIDYMRGYLAESWELPDDTTLIWHIRKGVYWQDRPGVMAARELTAEDVAFVKNRLIQSPKCPGYYKNMDKATALDKYTVELKFKAYDGNWALPMSWGYFQRIYPPEVVDAGIADWRNAVGTGPFILKDYVSGASLTWEKNPNYWDTTTIDGKEYKIPFVDRMVWPIIVDESTQLAALRTGKCDIEESVSWRNEETLAETNPELIKYRYISTTGPVYACRYDVEPFHDYRIRKALNMAIDRQAVIDSLYGGNAVLLSFPFSMEWGDKLYTPIEELSPEAQELFEYNPEKAKQLMADAGYPDGFKAEIVCTSGWVDGVSLLADYWSVLGVELEMQVVEYGVYYAIMRGKTHKHMYAMSKGNGDPFAVLMVIGLPGQYWNPAMFDDPYFNETYEKAQAETDPDEAMKILKHLNAYIIEQAPYVIQPVPYVYEYCFPWVKNWYGEVSSSTRSPGAIHARVWLDTALKKKMGY